MTKVVGITLILLGIWVLLSIIVEGKAFHPRSRFMILALIFQKIQMFLHDHISHHHHKNDVNEVVVGKKASLTLGMVHGIGAETPTQMLLFVTAAGIQRTVLAPLILLTFIGGLLVSNSVIATLSVLGYKAVSKSSWLRIGLGLLTAVVSIYVGVAFLGGNESTLPALLGG
jgi:high-affinity nickel-transport protein